MQPSQVLAAARLVYSFHNVSNQMDPGRKTQNQNLELFVIVWIFFLPSSCHAGLTLLRELLITWAASDMETVAV